MEEADVKEIFSPFGEIINMEMTKDEITRTNKGYAFIEYKTSKVHVYYNINTVTIN